MRDAVIDDGIELFGIDLAIFIKNALVCADVDDLSDANAVFVEFEKLTLNRHRQLVDDGRVDAFALGRVEARFCELVGLVVSRNDADIVAGNDGLCRGKAEGKRTRFLDIFSKNITASGDLENWMNVTARYVSELVDAQSVCIFMEEDGVFKVAGVFGAFPPLSVSGREFQESLIAKPKYVKELLKYEQFKMGEGLIGEIALHREDVFVQSPASDPRIAELGTLMIPIRSMLAVPLINDGKVSGVMCAVNSKNAALPFTQEQFLRFKFIASQVVLAQNMMRVYSTLSEQQRIAQELNFAKNLLK